MPREYLEVWSSQLTPIVSTFFATWPTVFFAVPLGLPSGCLKSIAWQIITRWVEDMSFRISTASCAFLNRDQA